MRAQASRRDAPMSDEKRPRPSALGDLLGAFLRQSGIAERVEQALVVPEWPQLVGERIARVTEPTAVTADGTLFVQVTTNAWMMELSLMEPEILAALRDGAPGRPPVRRIRWQLRRS